MTARPGRWDLLGYDADPITTQPDAVAELAKYYQDMANDIETSAAQLRPVGDGDLSAGEGESVDAVRGRARDVAKSLTQMQGRYTSAADAFTGFHTAVGTEGDRSGGGTVMAASWAALQAAEAADSELSRVTGTADPAKDATAAGREPTPEEQDDSTRRSNAIDQQKGALSGAHKQLEQAFSMLSDAGKRASSTMKGAWDDGLHDSLGYKILHMLIKIFTVIGMILAVLAFFIPGVGIAAIVGAIGAVFSVIAAGLKFAVGEGNILDVILAGIGLLTLGAGSAITKITSNAIGKGISAGKTALRSEGEKAIAVQQRIQASAARAADKASLRADRIRATISSGSGSIRNLEKLREQTQKITIATAKFNRAVNAEKKQLTTNLWREQQFASKFKDNPNWWNLGKMKTVWNNDKQLVKDQFGKDFFTKAGLTSWGERFAGIDGMVTRGNMNKWLLENGVHVPVQAPRWQYAVGAWGSIWGKGTFVATTTVFPTGLGSDTARPWTPWVNDHKGALPGVHTLWNPEQTGPAAHA